MEITAYSVERMKDPFGILAGERFQFILALEVAEDDELYSPNGVYAKIVYLVDEGRKGIIQCGLYEETTDKYLDFELEPEEEAELAAFCAEHLTEQ